MLTQDIVTNNRSEKTALLFEAETLRKYDGVYGSRKQHDNEKYQVLKAEGWVDKRKLPKKIVVEEEAEEEIEIKPKPTVDDELNDIKKIF